MAFSLEAGFSIACLAEILRLEPDAIEIAMSLVETAGTPELEHRLSVANGVDRVDWERGVLTILTPNSVIKLHSNQVEINERHGLVDRIYVRRTETTPCLAFKIYHRDSRDNVRDSNSPVHILGVVRNSHESGAALVRDGHLLGAIEEERLNLDKHSLGYFPKESTAYLLDAHGLEWRNIDHIAVTYDYNFFRPTKHSIDPNTSFRQAYGLPLPSTGIDERYNTERMQTFLEDLAINFGTGHIPPVTYVKHHKTHAASAYHASGFVDPTLVVTIDGQGEDESTTVWVGTDGTLRKISATVPFTHSVGHFYHIVTVLLGYRRNDEGKVMGFAPYGTPQTRQEEAVVDQLRALFADSMWFDRAKGQIQLNSENYEFSTNSIFPGLQFTSPFLRRLFKVIPEQPASHLGRNLSPANRNMAHLAFVAQERVEYVIADMIDYYRNEHSETNGIRHVAIAGGLALNIASNGKLIQQKIVDPDKLFVPAYPADDGTAVGAALSVAAEEYGLNVHRAQSSASYGRTYSPQQIQDVFTKFGLVEGVDYHRLHDDRTLVDVVAKSLAAEGTVAWFQGGSELGPRALGNRSILHCLHTPDGNEKVNRIKGREPWRPSALSIIEEKAARYLDGVATSPFMTIGFPVTPDRLKVIMAGVHPGDGTTRPQTVSRTVSPLYWELLDRVNKLTGVPGLLNTSFNRLGPIVETPEDALNTFYYCDGLDMLAIGHFLVQRRDSYRPSILNARDEASLGALFRTAQMQREPLTEAWDVFWTTAGTLADSTRRQNQGYLAIYAHTSRGEEELLRVPLIKEIFQTGTREAILGDICERIARKVGMQMPVTISVETTLRQFSRVIFDLFNNFLSRRGWTSWNLVSLGNAERRYFPPNGPLSLIKASEAIQRIEQTSQHSGDIQLIALTGPDISTRRLIVEHLQKDAGPRIWHIDGARWEKDQSQRNTALSYPFSQFDVPRFIRTMQRLRAGQSAMIPVRAPIPGAAASRGYASFSNDNAEVPRSLVTKPDSSLWIRHDAKVFEELRPAGGDIILVNAHVALNFPSTREAFSDSYYVASQFQVIDNTRGGVAIDSAFAQVWPHAHNIVISVDSDG